MPKIDTVFILGAGFTRAIGSCTINCKSFDSPLDKDFFSILESNGMLTQLLSDKPCLKFMLHWLEIYDKDTNKLKESGSSLEAFWAKIDIMRKLNSSINGFPDYYLFGGPTKKHLEPIPNIDDWKNEMSQHEQNEYNFISRDKNFWNPEGLLLYFVEYELKKLISQIYSNLADTNKDTLINDFKQKIGETPIISFNYDCLVEGIFTDHKLFNYDDRLELMDNSNLIIKPHGSLGWTVTKRYLPGSQKEEKGKIEIVDRKIDISPSKINFTTQQNSNTLDSKLPIIIPMGPGKENILSGIDAGRIAFCPDNVENKNLEFIDCVVSYAKMLEVIREAKKVVFIGYSFPQFDYDTTAVLSIAFKPSADKEVHICIKDRDIPKPNLPCNRIIYYKDGLEQLVREFR